MERLSFRDSVVLFQVQDMRGCPDGCVVRLKLHSSSIRAWYEKVLTEEDYVLNPVWCKP
jgi:hypothetical protein